MPIYGEDIKSWRLPKHNPLTTSGVPSSLETLSRMFLAGLGKCPARNHVRGPCLQSLLIRAPARACFGCWIEERGWHHQQRCLDVPKPNNNKPEAQNILCSRLNGRWRRRSSSKKPTWTSTHLLKRCLVSKQHLRHLLAAFLSIAQPFKQIIWLNTLGGSYDQGRASSRLKQVYCQF